MLLNPGEHVRAIRPLGYDHHGIFEGHGMVIHFTAAGPSKEGARISRTTLREFSAGDRVEVVEYGRCDPADVVLARARSLLGKGSYDLFASNCEHFARWCKTGEAASEQVRRALAVATTVGGGSAALAGGLGTVAAGGLAGLSGPGIMSGLASIGGTAVGGVVVLATAPVALTTAAMHNALRDDVALPARERAARSAGRLACLDFQQRGSRPALPA